MDCSWNFVDITVSAYFGQIDLYANTNDAATVAEPTESSSQYSTLNIGMIKNFLRIKVLIY